MTQRPSMTPLRLYNHSFFSPRQKYNIGMNDSEYKSRERGHIFHLRPDDLQSSSIVSKEIPAFGISSSERFDAPMEFTSGLNYYSKIINMDDKISPTKSQEISTLIISDWRSSTGEGR